MELRPKGIKLSRLDFRSVQAKSIKIVSIFFERGENLLQNAILHSAFRSSGIVFESWN